MEKRYFCSKGMYVYQGKNIELEKTIGNVPVPYIC